MMNMEVSVVVPIYNEADNIVELYRRLRTTLTALGQTGEIIFVDDGSSDNSLALLKQIAQQDETVTVVVLVRNFGQHAAIAAGFKQARGQIIVTLDADLQNPPEEIPKLLAAMTPAVDLVAGWRQIRQDNPWRRFASKAINRLTNRILQTELHDYGCMLRAFRRELVQQILATQEKTLFIPALTSWLKARTVEVPVEHRPRQQGESKYPIFKLLQLNFDLVTSTSTFPIQTISLLGLISASFGLALGLYILYRRLTLGPEVEGVFTLFAFSFILFGILLVVIGVIGEYIARIHQEVRQRPLYIEKAVITAPNTPDVSFRQSSGGNPRTPSIVSCQAHAGMTKAVFDREIWRVILCGYHDIGYAVLQQLGEMGIIRISAVVTHADDPQENIWFKSVRELAFARNIPVFQPQTVRTTDFIQRIKDLEPDLIVSAHFREILPEALLKTARLGGVNLHTSLLPKYRGRAPINWAIINGETETGLTLHRMEKRADRGPIYYQQRIPISRDDTAPDVYRAMCAAIPTVLGEGLCRVFDPAFQPSPQNEARATQFGRRTPEDGRIDWRQSAEEIHNLVRAVTKPYPGAFVDNAAGCRCLIWRTAIGPETDSGLPGNLLGWHDGHPMIRTGSGTLLILEYDFSKGGLTVSDFFPLA